MAGINLSQSLQEKQAQAQGSFFDKGLYINLFILVFTLIVFGGTHWYLSRLENQSGELDVQAVSKIHDLQGPEAEHVADFRNRLDDIAKNITSEPDPAKLFSRVENAMVPNVQLTNYEEKWQDQTVRLEGRTDNLKFLAQEILALKRVEDFKKVSVETVKYEANSKIKFSLIIDAPHASQ